MAAQVIYKNIGIENEATWGASVAGNARVLTIVSSSLNSNPNKELVEETNTSPKGRNRITIGRNEIDGDIMGYASPKLLHNMLEWVSGSAGVSSATGSSALTMTYNQNTDNTFVSRTVTQDRNQSQEKFSGLRASKFNLTFSDGLAEITTTLIGKARATGISLSDITGETIKPFEFADFTVQVGNAALANPTTVAVSNFELTYSNGLERAHLSGSRDASRIDGGVASLEGSFEIFHEGTSFVSPVYGCSELYIRLEATTVSCHGQIAGVTPYYMRINIPRSSFTTNERNYEQASMAKETINFVAMFDPGTSALWTPSLVAGLDINS